MKKYIKYFILFTNLIIITRGNFLNLAVDELKNSITEEDEIPTNKHISLKPENDNKTQLKKIIQSLV